MFSKTGDFNGVKGQGAIRMELNLVCKLSYARVVLNNKKVRCSNSRKKLNFQLVLFAYMQTQNFVNNNSELQSRQEDSQRKLKLIIK